MTIGTKSKVFFFVALILCAPAHAMWRQAFSRTLFGINQNKIALGVIATAGVMGLVYARKTPAGVDQARPVRVLASPSKSDAIVLENGAVVLWGMNNVLFEPVHVPWVLHIVGVTPKTFKDILYKDLQKIPKNEIPGAQELPKNAVSPFMVAWLTGRISCDQAKELVLKHTDIYSPSRYIAQRALTPQDLAHHLSPNKAVILVVSQCRRQGAIVGVSTSANGEVFDAIVATHQFLKTEFDVFFVSGKIGLMTSDPLFYDAIKKKFPGKKMYLVDAPGPALTTAKQKGIIPIAFVASDPDAVQNLQTRLKAEGLVSETHE